MKRNIIIIAGLIAMLLGAAGKTNAQVNWTYSQTVDSVDFYYSIQECNGDSVVFLKFTNNNNDTVTVEWSDVFDTQFGNAQASHHGLRQAVLAPGTAEQLDCETGCPECLILCTEMMDTYKAIITGFAFDTISVTQ